MLFLRLLQQPGEAVRDLGRILSLSMPRAQTGKASEAPPCSARKIVATQPASSMGRASSHKVDTRDRFGRVGCHSEI